MTGGEKKRLTAEEEIDTVIDRSRSIETFHTRWRVISRLREIGTFRNQFRESDELVDISIKISS